MATKAQQKFAQEQALRRLLAEDGIRFVGVYGAPYPMHRDVTRYHVILNASTEVTYSYEDVDITLELVLSDPRYVKYADSIGKKGKQAVEGTTTYAETACNLGYRLRIATTHPDYLDIQEMVEVGQERATDAPVCTKCARIAGITA